MGPVLERLISWWRSKTPQPTPPAEPPKNGGASGAGESGFE